MCPSSRDSMILAHRSRRCNMGQALHRPPASNDGYRANAREHRSPHTPAARDDDHCPGTASGSESKHLPDRDSSPVRHARQVEDVWCLPCVASSNALRHWPDRAIGRPRSAPVPPRARPPTRRAPSPARLRIRVAGINGRIRGMKFKRADGQSVRPSLVLIDDPQTDESARSQSQCVNRERVLAGAAGVPKGAPAAGLAAAQVRQADWLPGQPARSRLRTGSNRGTGWMPNALSRKLITISGWAGRGTQRAPLMPSRRRCHPLHSPIALRSSRAHGQ